MPARAPGLLLAALLGLTAPAAAQDYPSRPVTIVAPAAPGGLYSLFARLIGSKLEQRFGKPFVVENRPGASSIVGVKSVISAPHDGHTLIVMNNTGMAVNVSMVKGLPYDPRKDLVPVALIAHIPEVLVVNAALPVQSLDDLGRLARATPGGLSYGSPGAGTGPHLSGVMLGSALGVPVTHVPYKGMSPAINDVAGGHIAFMFSPIPPAAPLAAAGKIRMLGVTSLKRSAALPQVPTLDESGLKGYDFVTPILALVRAGTPAPIVEAIGAAMTAAAAQPEFKELCKVQGLDVAIQGPAELKAAAPKEFDKAKRLVQLAGVQVQR
jgi:tripartite-type tricarboxylate transporter receptor subunit TctC